MAYFGHFAVKLGKLLVNFLLLFFSSDVGLLQELRFPSVNRIS